MGDNPVYVSDWFVMGFERLAQDITEPGKVKGVADEIVWITVILKRLEEGR